MNRYPHEDLLLKPRSLRWLLKRLLHSSNFVDFLWFLATLAIIAACIALGWYESMRSLP